jgi:hypothetical protein
LGPGTNGNDAQLPIGSVLSLVAVTTLLVGVSIITGFIRLRAAMFADLH